MKNVIKIWLVDWGGPASVRPVLVRNWQVSHAMRRPSALSSWASVFKDVDGNNHYVTHTSQAFTSLKEVREKLRAVGEKRLAGAQEAVKLQTAWVADMEQVLSTLDDSSDGYSDTQVGVTWLK
jgi:hypothetical protein